MAYLSASVAEAQPRLAPASAPIASHRLPLWPACEVSATERVSWSWLVALTALATAVRIPGLNQQLWFDEIVTIETSVREPLKRIITSYDLQNQHMLYSVLAHLSWHLFGESAWSLRLPAALFGIAAVPAMYFFARLLASNGEALWAAALLAVNYQEVWFSQNARGYTGMLFWTILSSIFLVRACRDLRARDWILYGLAAAFGIYTHLTMAFVIAGQALLYAWLVSARIYEGRKLDTSHLRPLYGFVLAGIVSLLLYSPVIAQVAANTVASSVKPLHTEWTNPVWSALEAVRGLKAGSAGGLVAIGIAATVVLTGMWSLWRANRYALGLMLLPALVTFAGVLVTSHNLWPRFFFFEIGFALLFVVKGATEWGRAAARLLGQSTAVASRFAAALLVLVMLSAVPPLRAEYLHPKQDFIGAMKFVEQHKGSTDAVVTVGMVTKPFDEFYGQSWPMIETPQQLESTLADGHHAWLIYAMPIAVRAYQPDVWAIVQTEFHTVRVFGGTLAGGELYVCESNETGNSGTSN
jgi:mannosyltransferase